MSNFNESFLIQKGIRDFITTPRPYFLKVLRQRAYWTLRVDSSGKEIEETLGHSLDKLHALNPKLAPIPKLTKGTVIVYPGKALGVSYTEEGLKRLSTSRGEMLYYRNALFANAEVLNPKTGLKEYTYARPQGPLEVNRSLIVEDFFPHDHVITHKGKKRINRNFQSAEIMCVDKALRLLYVPSGVKLTDEKVLVYSSKDKANES